MKKYIIFASTFYYLNVACKEYEIPIREVIWYKGGKLPNTIRGRYKWIKNGEIKCIGVSKEYILQMYMQGKFE